jgi:ABC-type multidrug transport system ATPase subunit
MTGPAPTVVATKGLTKRFGRVTAVEGVDLEVREGDLFGFLGPNGSGKTTTLRMLLGLVFATSGEIEILGHPMPSRSKEVLPHVGTLVEGPAFYPHLSGPANLSLLDAAGPGGTRRTRKQRLTTALERVGLAHVGRRQVKAYSSGMKQRLGLAAALVRPHRLLILDEPTNGLDPLGMREIREVLRSLIAGGTTILLSSHLLSEVEAICNRAAIVYRGRLVAQDRVASLLAPTGSYFIETPDVARAAMVLAATPGAHVLEVQADRIKAHLNGIVPNEVNKSLVDEGVRVDAFTPERRSLEEVFMDLTKSEHNIVRG